MRFQPRLAPEHLAHLHPLLLVFGTPQGNGAHVRRPCFMLSGFEERERATLGAQLRALGATVEEGAALHPSCTHVVARRLGRTEKVWNG